MVNDSDMTRIELSVHTTYGDGDSICNLREVIDKAYNLGLGGIAVTDHMSVLAYPEMEYIKNSILKEYNDFKILYGMEASVVDTTLLNKEEERLPFLGGGAANESFEVDCNNVSILIKNDEGKRNLFKLLSNLRHEYLIGDYLDKTELFNNREGLLLGSGNFKGELYQAILWGKSPDVIKEIASHYDYLELVPYKNPRLMLYEDKVPFVSENRLMYINIIIYMMGKELSIPVVVSGDVRFINEQDYRSYALLEQVGFNRSQIERFKVIGEKIKDFRYLHSVEELEEEFPSFEEDEDLMHMLILDTNRVGDMVDPDFSISNPQYNIFDEGIELLESECKKALLKMYGNNPEKQITDRLEKEIELIKTNGYESYYIMAKKIADAVKEKGYNMSTRDRSGCSLVAYLLGITSVNPLQRHIYCEKCFYHKFYEPSEKLSEKCPVCDTYVMLKGSDLSYEAFMGADGSIVPDFSLNIPANIRDNVIADVKKYTNGIYPVGQSREKGREHLKRVASDYFYYIDSSQKDINDYLSRIESVGKVLYSHGDKFAFVPPSGDINEVTPLFKYREVTYNRGRTIFNECYKDITVFDGEYLKKQLPVMTLTKSSMETALCELASRTGVSKDNISGYDVKILEELKKTCAVADEEIPIFLNGIVESTKYKYYPDLRKVRSYGGLVNSYISFLSRSGDGYIPSKAEVLSDVYNNWCLLYYKVNYPLDFYVVYYSIMTVMMDYSTTRKSYDQIKEKIEEISNKPIDKIDDRDKYIMNEYLIIKDMLDNGISFCEIDLLTADEKYYTVTEDNKIMPSLESIGLDETHRLGFIEYYNGLEEKTDLKNEIYDYMLSAVNS